MLIAMNWCSRITTFLLLAVLFFSGGGCGRFTTSSVDEEKEVHYLAGKNRLYSHDYRGAKEAFEQALLVIPKSAAAHLELGLLNYEQFGDHAEAIHHFERMLRFSPDHPVADRIKDQIQVCKLALASEVTLPPVNKRIESEMKRLITENDGLTNLVNQLKGQIGQLKNSLARAAIPTPGGTQGAGVKQPSSSVGRSSTPAREPRVTETPSRREAPAPATRQARMHLKHVLKSGETFYSLARRYRLNFKAIQKVNPGLRPTALKIGQVVNIPLSQTASAR
jgi:LysM repeat protein